MKRYILQTTVLIGLVSMSVAANASDFDRIFLSALTEKRLKFRALDEDRYEVDMPQGARSVYVGNVKRNFERDKDAAAIGRFVDRILAIQPQESLPNWAEAKRHLFPLLESSEVEVGKETITRSKSDRTKIMLAFHVEGSGEIRFVQSFDLERWGVSSAVAWQTAFDQLNERAMKTEVTLLDAGGVSLALISAEEPYKASLLLASNLRKRVPPSLGWPLVAVAPARDFVYLLSKAELQNAPGLGTVVVREFKQSGYPISTEVWELSDSGIEAIGEYPVK